MINISNDDVDGMVITTIIIIVVVIIMTIIFICVMVVTCCFMLWTDPFFYDDSEYITGYLAIPNNPLDHKTMVYVACFTKFS